jgi:hypothetical protein
MDPAIETLQRLVRDAVDALTRRNRAGRPERERRDDLTRARFLHEDAATMVRALRRQDDLDAESCAVLAAVETELRDLRLLLSHVLTTEPGRPARRDTIGA